MYKLLILIANSPDFVINLESDNLDSARLEAIKLIIDKNVYGLNIVLLNNNIIVAKGITNRGGIHWK